MEELTVIDTKQYLAELIQHYNNLLEENKVQELNTFIQEEKLKCQVKLYKLRELDMEAMFLASPF